MHRLGLTDVERVLTRRRAALLLGKPPTPLDKRIARARRLFAADPEELRRVVLCYLQHPSHL
jgi:hypothetical protein